MEKLVTKEFLAMRIKENPILIIGRALAAILNNQTASEAASNTTKLKNGIGFSANDARIGSLAAKYYLKHGTLLEWQLKPWLKLNKQFQPRIVKYADQLNLIAHEKRKSKRTFEENLHIASGWYDTKQQSQIKLRPT
jgi:hypothetical protein